MNPRNIKLTLEYDGSNFHGWQIQAKSMIKSQQFTVNSSQHAVDCKLLTVDKPLRTVQGELKRSLEKICKENINVLGSGRTDSGVHALGQVAHFQTNTDKSCTLLHRALNANLPEDISVVRVKEVPLKFHAQFSVKSKTYRYLILNRNSRSPIEKNHVFFYPHKVNLKLMKEEARVLVGKHDFKAFQSSNIDSFKEKSTIRTISKLDIKKKGDLISIDIAANGFMYKMVRNIVGTLLSIAAGQLPKGSTKKILKSKDRTTAPAPVKAQGLYLLEVEY